MFKFIDLFAGIGGFRLPLEEVGGSCVFSSEINKYCKTTYKTNFGEEPSGDIREIEASSIPSHDMLTAGFPCQSFSISGNQGGFEDTRGTLFYEIARIAKHHQPRVLLLENVKHLLHHNGGETFEVIKRTLENINYDVYHQVMNASKYGVPQSRKRVFIVCFRKDLEISNFIFPEPTYEKVALKDVLLPDEETEEYVVNNIDVDWKEDVQLNLMRAKLKPIRIGTVNKGGQGERIYDINGHAITLSAHGGGIFSKTGGYLVNGKTRKLAPRECARLMGFPEDFKIPVSDAQAWTQFGNSVVIPLVEKLMNKILDTGVFEAVAISNTSERAGVNH